MAYHADRKKAFRELARSILTSKFPVTESAVVTLAWNIQEETYSSVSRKGKQKASKKLDLHKIFYVYILMDPRCPGSWAYALPGGKTLTLPFLPIYVGKGNGKRMYDHVKLARKFPKPTKGERKLNKIRKIHREGLRVIAKKLSVNDIESVSFAKEIILIKAIGRKDKKLGPLTNQTDGGDGASGLVHTRETRERLRVKMTGRFVSVETRNKIGDLHRGKVVSESTREKLKEAGKLRKMVMDGQEENIQKKRKF